MSCGASRCDVEKKEGCSGERPQTKYTGVFVTEPWVWGKYNTIVLAVVYTVFPTLKACIGTSGMRYIPLVLFLSSHNSQIYFLSVIRPASV